jgi:hypothetical protein
MNLEMQCFITTQNHFMTIFKKKTNKYPATHKKYIRQKYDCIRTLFTTGVWNGRIRRSYKGVVHRI